MISLKDLKLANAAVVYESKLPNQAKIQLLNFIKNEASEVQLKALLLDGQIISKVDEVTEQIINDRFAVSEAGGRIATLRKSASSLQFGGSALWALYRKIRGHYDICTSRCGKYELNTARRQVCMIKCKIDKVKAQLAKAKQYKDSKEGSKLEADLKKAENTYSRYQASFKERGSEL
jgi:hypothetical protein